MSGYQTTNTGHDTNQRMPQGMNDGNLGHSNCNPRRLQGTTIDLSQQSQSSGSHRFQTMDWPCSQQVPPSFPSRPIDDDAFNSMTNSFDPRQQGMNGGCMGLISNQHQHEVRVAPVNLSHQQLEIPIYDNQSKPQGTPINFAQFSQAPVNHTTNSGYAVNPQMSVHHEVGVTPVNHSQQLSQMSIDDINNIGYAINPQMSAHHQVGRTPINHGQLPSQISTDDINNIGYTINLQMSAHHQIGATPVNHGQPSQLPANHNQHQAQNASYNCAQQQLQVQGHYTGGMGNVTGQQASIDYQVQSAPFHLERQDTDKNGYNISQRAPTYCQVQETPVHCGQQRQMPVDQIRHNRVSNKRHVSQGMAASAVALFSQLSAKDQIAEYNHFVQQRRAQGETQIIEFGKFKDWYIGQQLNGNSTPTYQHGVAPLH